MLILDFKDMTSNSLHFYELRYRIVLVWLIGKCMGIDNQHQ